MATAVVPWTGESLDLDIPKDAAWGLELALRFKRELAEFEAACRRTLVEEADRRGSLSFDLNDVHVRVSGETVERKYDTDALAANLREAGLELPRINEVVFALWKVSEVELNKLRKFPHYADAIQRSVVSEEPKRRSVRIEG